MASNGSSEVDPEEENGESRFSAEKTGRAADYPDFAIIWSFLENFRHLLHFQDLSLDDLEDGFNSHSRENGNVEIVEELYKKLLRRLGVSVNPEKWEKSLLKVAKEQGLDCSWDLEQFGYEELKVSSKLELFKVLLECQFDQNDKLKSSVNKGYDAGELRMQPIGRDLDGFIYWYHEDGLNGVRLYLTEEDEVNCESWRLLAGETDELAAVVDFLESKSLVNPKDIALARREEMKKKNKKESKSPGKKKGKKAKKESIPEEDYDDDNPCARCFSNVRPDSILLCDKCDAAYHTACLRPPLLTVPQGDWFCPFCQQLAMLEVLRAKKQRLAARMRLRQRQAKRLGFAGIDLNNIVEHQSDDEDEMGIRRSGRSRKTVDYTFKEFEDDITSAVENDKKRYKDQQEVNGEEHLLYSKPAYETGKFYATTGQQRETRRSRRLRDLDYESDSESRTSGYENDGNSDEDGQRISSKHARMKIIDEDEDDVGGGNDVDKDDEVPDEPESEANKSSGETQEVDQDANENPSDVMEAENCVTQKSDVEEESGKLTDKSTLDTSTVTDASGPSSAQPQTTAPPPPGNKIHPHSRIASVAPIARHPPMTGMNNYRLPTDYNQEAVFPTSPNFDVFKQQAFSSTQSPNYNGSNFGGVTVGTPNTVGATIGMDGSSSANVGGSVVSGGGLVQGPNVTRTNFGGPSFPGGNLGDVLNPMNFGGANIAGGNLGGPNVSGTHYAGPNISGANFGGPTIPGALRPGTNVAGPNILGASLGTNFGGTNFGGTNVAGFGTIKSPTQTVPSSFWGPQNKSSNSYNYPGFSPVAGTAPVSSAPVNNPGFPSPFNPAAGYPENNQYGNFNQQYQASPMQTNYFPPQQSGNFQDSGFLSPAPQRPPPPPYSATNSMNANFFTNNPPEAPLTGNQWPYPEGYGYYPGQGMGNTAGQNF